jgi:hypothetical protein
MRKESVEARSISSGVNDDPALRTATVYRPLYKINRAMQIRGTAQNKKEKDMQIELGSRVRDTVSGFKGIAVARTCWLHGCVRITISPEKTDNGKILSNETFDEPQVEYVDKKSHAAKPSGGEYAPPSRAKDPN